MMQGMVVGVFKLILEGWKGASPVKSLEESVPGPRLNKCKNPKWERVWNVLGGARRHGVLAAGK